MRRRPLVRAAVFDNCEDDMSEKKLTMHLMFEAQWAVVEQVGAAFDAVCPHNEPKRYDVVRDEYVWEYGRLQAILQEFLGVVL
jgi:hypothetical protein